MASDDIPSELRPRGSIDGDAEDEQLLERWRAGDNRAGERLLARYGPRLLGFFANKGVRTPEDLVQATLMACVESRERFRGEGRFAAFVFGIGRNKLLKHYRERRGEAVDFAESAVCDLEPGASTVVQQARDRRAVLEALRRVPVDDQILLELYYWQNMTGAQLAQTFAVPEGTIRTRLLAAKKRVNRELAQVTNDGVALLRSTASSLDDWAQAVHGRDDTSGK